MNLSADDFDYPLPPELIAQHPPEHRGQSRLLHVGRNRLEDKLFGQLPSLLRSGDLLVLNDTRVIKARLLGEKDSGGRVEALVERLLGKREALVQLRASKTPRPGARLRFDGALDAVVVRREGEFFHLRFDADEGLLAALDRHGRVPLPPYITHADDDSDVERYQTVYARDPGSVAAPTAGLHFDAALLQRLAALGVAHCFVTLHVGAGTFQPLRVNSIAEHRMHAERYRVPPRAREAILAARARGGAVIAVGTTSVRTLEAAALENPRGETERAPAACAGDTRLFITPGFRFRVVDRLVTNFHLPRSTLMMLVSAFAGMERIRAAYAHAIQRRYRFFSYGDAMFLERDDAR